MEKMRHILKQQRITGTLLLLLIGLPVVLLLAKHSQDIRQHAAGGSSYYVATNGSDSNPGTLSSPWKTISGGAAHLQAGDTMYVRGGTYVETLSFSAASATAGSRILVTNYNGERVILQGLVRVKSINYWTFDGINVTWPSTGTSGDHMIKFSDAGAGWRWTNAEIWGAHSFAAVHITGNNSNWSIDHNVLHDTYKSNATNQDHLIYFSSGTGGGIIERNIFYNSLNGRGVKLGPAGGEANCCVTIRYNTFYNNMGPSNIQVSFTASNHQIYRNIMQKSSAQNVTAFSLSGSGNVAYDNIGFDSAGVVDTSSSGLRDGGGNKVVDPQFFSLSNYDFRTNNPTVVSYGRFADEIGVPPLPTTPLQPTATPTPVRPTATPTIANSPTVTPTPRPTITPTRAPTAPPESTSQSTTLLIQLQLHGLGNAGDNANPIGGNTSPKHTSKSVQAELVNAQGDVVSSGTGNVAYQATTKQFSGSIVLVNTTNGTYRVRVSSPGYLPTFVPGIITVSSTQNNLPVTTLTTGDANHDMKLDILDYNQIIGCYLNEVTCSTAQKDASDIDDNGVVDITDYNLFIREMSIQRGQ